MHIIKIHSQPFMKSIELLVEETTNPDSRQYPLLSVTFPAFYIFGIGAEFYESSKWVRLSGLLPLGVFLQAVSLACF